MASDLLVALPPGDVLKVLFEHQTVLPKPMTRDEVRHLVYTSVYYGCENHYNEYGNYVGYAPCTYTLANRILSLMLTDGGTRYPLSPAFAEAYQSEATPNEMAAWREKTQVQLWLAYNIAAWLAGDDDPPNRPLMFSKKFQGPVMSKNP